MQLLNRIKKALDIPFIPPTPFAQNNEVSMAHKCPKCGERDIDQLLLDDETKFPDAEVTCLTCDNVYLL